MPKSHTIQVKSFGAWIARTSKQGQKQDKNQNAAQLFLVCLLGLLVRYPCFYFNCPIAVIVGLNIELTIDGVMSMGSEIAIDLLG